MTKSNLQLAAATLWIAVLPIHATTISAVAGNVKLKLSDTVNGPYQSLTPTDNPKIQWFSGANILDGSTTQNPRVSLGAAQNYFGANNAPQALGPVTMTFGPTAKNGSTVTSSGEGQSHADQKPGVGTVYTADWSATATGTLGSVSNAVWHAHTDGVDPWNLDISNFSSAPGLTYDLFFAAGLTGADFDSADSSMSFDVGYRTGAGLEQLLGLSADGSGSHVTIGSVQGLEIFLLSSATDGPEDISGSPLTAAAIQGLLQGLVNTGDLSSPLIFGFELNGQAAPTQDLGGGVVASFSAVAGVSDGASGPATSTPEPTSFSLLAAGGTLIALGRLRKRR
jgi:hypothetical protein